MTIKIQALVIVQIIANTKATTETVNWKIPAIFLFSLNIMFTPRLCFMLSFIGLIMAGNIPPPLDSKQEELKNKYSP